MPGRAAMGVLRDAIAEAMRAKTDESPGIKSKMDDVDDVAEAVAAMKRDLIGELEDEAQAARRGLWADREPVPPWDWRAGEADRKAKARAAAGR